MRRFSDAHLMTERPSMQPLVLTERGNYLWIEGALKVFFRISISLAIFLLWLTCCVNTSFVFLPLRYTWSVHRFYEESNGEEIPSNRRERKRYVHLQKISYTQSPVQSHQYHYICPVGHSCLKGRALTWAEWRTSQHADLPGLAALCEKCSHLLDWTLVCWCNALPWVVSRCVALSQYTWLSNNLSFQLTGCQFIISLTRMMMQDECRYRLSYRSLSDEWWQIFGSHFLTILEYHVPIQVVPSAGAPRHCWLTS